MSFLAPVLPVFSPSRCGEGALKYLGGFAACWGQPTTGGQKVQDSVVTSPATVRNRGHNLLPQWSRTVLAHASLEGSWDTSLQLTIFYHTALPFFIEESVYSNYLFNSPKSQQGQKGISYRSILRFISTD